MPLTTSPLLVTRKIRDRLVEWSDELGIQQVWYGDQAKIPQSPSVCIEPGLLQRQLAGDPIQTQNDFTVVIIVYVAGLQDIQQTQEEADDLCDRIAEKLNVDSVSSNMGGTQLDGLIIWGMVTEHQYGYAVRSNKLMRANRLVWTGTNKTGLVA